MFYCCFKPNIYLLSSSPSIAPKTEKFAIHTVKILCRQLGCSTQFAVAEIAAFCMQAAISASVKCVLLLTGLLRVQWSFEGAGGGVSVRIVSQALDAGRHYILTPSCTNQRRATTNVLLTRPREIASCTWHRRVSSSGAGEQRRSGNPLSSAQWNLLVFDTDETSLNSRQ